MTTCPPYDLVVFGATGFVGKILCEYLIAHGQTDTDLKWAIAGRSETKLTQLVTVLGPRGADLPRIIADAADEVSLRDLCAQTRVVVSTVGPYALYGEPLVKVCAETGTDYCDLTGEAQWVQRMIQTYGDVAERSGARIIHCCGFDSIPSDLGTYYLQRQAQSRFGQFCTRVKMQVKAAQGGVSGGTVASGINAVKEVSADPALQQALIDPHSLCPTGYGIADHPPTLIPVQYDADFQGWVAPFVMAAINTRIVLRSSALLSYGSDFKYEEGMLTGPGLPGWVAAQLMQVSLAGLALLSALAPTRGLLEKLVPAPGQGPSIEAQEQGFYDLRFWGQTAKDETLRVKVMGDRDPGYGSTAKILGQAGICLAKDWPKSEKSGGFWTPAAMFGETLINRLVDYAGLSFEVL